ncbi:MAG: CU044_2847 family protein [Pseudonocardiaceae bacterium]
MELVAVPLESGGVIVVEMDHAEGGVVKAGRPGQVVAEAAQTLEAALEPVTLVAQSILAKLRQSRSREITVEFGVNLTVEAGAVITKAAGGCHLKVKLRWGPSDDTDR